MADGSAPYPIVSGNSLCFRLGGRRAWVKSDGSPSRDAFVLRMNHDTDGLSVSLGTVTNGEAASKILSKTYAVWWLIVGEIRTVGSGFARPVDVIQDADDHGIIAGLPPSDVDLLLAENIAKELSLRAHCCWPTDAASYTPEPILK